MIVNVAIQRGLLIGFRGPFRLPLGHEKSLSQGTGPVQSFDALLYERFRFLIVGNFLSAQNALVLLLPVGDVRRYFAFKMNRFAVDAFVIEAGVHVVLRQEARGESGFFRAKLDCLGGAVKLMVMLRQRLLGHVLVDFGR